MTDIPLYPGDSYPSPHDYGTIRVQGGATGIVLPRDGSPGYTTAFVECFPPGSFFRGQGSTVTEADDACWAKLQAYLSCPGHVWEPRNYRNGSGVCAVCGQYGHDVLTAAQLGYHCTICGEPTFNTLTGSKTSEPRCADHDPKVAYVDAAIKALFHGFDAETEAMRGRLDAVVDGDVDEDPEALTWAYANLDMSRTPRKEAS
jgi:hypothetical protein